MRSISIVFLYTASCTIHDGSTSASAADLAVPKSDRAAWVAAQRSCSR